MPRSIGYPGVYSEELPGGGRTITGVETSITAFVGRTLRGPTDADAGSPVLVTSFGDFERTFGGLWIGSALSFAVRDFFLNGGTRALIVRCHLSDGGNAHAQFQVDVLPLRAAYPGSWGDAMRVRVDHATRLAIPPEAPNSLFNLTIQDMKSGQIEEFRNVSVSTEHPRRIDRVLEEESVLVRMSGDLPETRPAAHATVPEGEDPFAEEGPHPTRYTAVSTSGTDGAPLTQSQLTAPELEPSKLGMYALLRASIFNLLCIPPHALESDLTTSNRDLETNAIHEAIAFCRARRVFFIVDPPYGSTIAGLPATSIQAFKASIPATSFAALYFPNLRQPNPLNNDQQEDFAPCGAIAGVMARTDAARGVWKAPAGTNARLVGVTGLSAPLSVAENGILNPLGINCLRTLPVAGRVVWGARTLEGDDRLGSPWKYIPVRRTALMIEESIYRGTRWVVFEPNDEPLWARIRLHVGEFMNGLFSQGALAGNTARDSYFVKCGTDTTTQSDIDRGLVNIEVGFAALKPAEFVLIRIQQMTGDVRT